MAPSFFFSDYPSVHCTRSPKSPPIASPLLHPLDLGALYAACSMGRRYNTNDYCGCSSVVEHLLAKERVESSNLFIRFFALAFIDFLTPVREVFMSWHEPRALLFRSLLLDWLGQILILGVIFLSPGLTGITSDNSYLHLQLPWLVFLFLLYPLLGWLFGSYTVLRWRRCLCFCYCNGCSSPVPHSWYSSRPLAG